METEHKAVSVSGVKSAIDVVDDTQGIVEAFVSVTGIRDNVGDIIEPGAYAKSLAKRTPKGIWHHDWKHSVSKTLEVKELLPLDPELPATLPNGEPWPSHAGALKVKMQFNLNTQRGKEAYEDIKFFGDQQEWSIGYQVPQGKARVGVTKIKSDEGGVSEVRTRFIKELELFEYSPVLFGAMSNTRTTSVKSAQETLTELKTSKGDGVYAFLNEVSELTEIKGLPDEDTNGEVTMLSPEQMDELKSFISTEIKSAFVAVEEKAVNEYDDDTDLVDIAESAGIDDEELLEKAADFERALEDGTLQEIDEKALAFVVGVQELGFESKASDALLYVKSAVTTVAELESDEEEDDEEYDVSDDDEYSDDKDEDADEKGEKASDVLLEAKSLLASLDEFKSQF